MTKNLLLVKIGSRFRLHISFILFYFIFSALLLLFIEKSLLDLFFFFSVEPSPKHKKLTTKQGTFLDQPHTPTSLPATCAMHTSWAEDRISLACQSVPELDPYDSDELDVAEACDRPEDCSLRIPELCLDLTDSKPVAQGYFSKVYRYGHIYAVKLIEPKHFSSMYSQDEMDAYEREKRNLHYARLHCDNETVTQLIATAVCMIRGPSGRVEERRGFVFPFVKHGDLTRTLRRGQHNWSLLDRMKMARDLLISIDTLHHTVEMAHLDITSDNILVGKSENLILADFGLSQRIPEIDFSRVTLTHSTRRAPEVLGGVEFDPLKADIFSLSLVFYHLFWEIEPRGQSGPNKWANDFRPLLPSRPSPLDTQLFGLLQDMWAGNPDHRIPTDIARQRLDTLIQAEEIRERSTVLIPPRSPIVIRRAYSSLDGRPSKANRFRRKHAGRSSK